MSDKESVHFESLKSYPISSETTLWDYSIIKRNKLGQYDRPRVLGCEPVDGVLVVLSSNKLNIAIFVHQMVDTHLPSGEQKWQYLFDLNLCLGTENVNQHSFKLRYT